MLILFTSRILDIHYDLRQVRVIGSRYTTVHYGNVFELFRWQFIIQVTFLCRYNPPEVARDKTTVAEVSPRKCDAWSLGLLCWEVHKRRQHYFRDPHIQELLSRAGPQAYLPNDDGKDHRSLDQESAQVLSQKLLDISSMLVGAAEDWVDLNLSQSSSWSYLDRLFLKAVFKNTLKANPLERSDNIARLPLIHKTRYS